ncbi:MAG TPA: FAD:protein FMN transferase [Thermoleophilaceae bacterium]|nr:FAD:protein FMN transferase [Thermoleophilaceae bacterium]
MSGIVVTLRAPTVDVTFRALGTDVRLIATGHGAEAAIGAAREAILDYHARLSRFLPESELSALNRDPRPVVPASALLRSAVRAGMWAAERSGGLVDPCLLNALEAAGYVGSYRPDGTIRLPSGPPRVATPHPDRSWRAVRVDDDAGTIERTPGLRLDLGGSGKGHVADLIAERLAQFRSWVVDCGGDVRVGGRRQVQVAHPLAEAPAAELTVDGGAVATSSVVSRAWRSSDGRSAHHLLDPCSGHPVQTGLLSATALATTTLEAETLAKIALLRGARDARRVLAGGGGVLVHADGRVETVGRLLEAAA